MHDNERGRSGPGSRHGHVAVERCNVEPLLKPSCFLHFFKFCDTLLYAFLDNYEPLDMAPLVPFANYHGQRMVGYVLLVAFSCSQLIFVRKELRMSERGRKRIVVKVCVLSGSCNFITD